MRLAFLIGLVLLLTVSCSQKDDSPEELMVAGKAAFDNRDYYDARLKFAKAVEADPSGREHLLWLGRTYLRERMFDSAAFFLSRADLLFPDNREILLELYPACRDAMLYQEARRAGEKLLLMRAAGDTLYEGLTEMAVRAGEYMHALYFSQELIKVFPDEAQYYLDAASLAAQNDSAALAVEILSQAVDRLGPKDGLIVNLAVVQVAAGDLASAERNFRLLLTSQPQSVEFKINLANVLSSQEQRSKKQEALQLYQEAIPYLPNGSQVESKIAALRKELGRPPK